MNQPVTRAPLASVVAEATKLSVVGTVELLAGELTVTVTVAKAAEVASKEASITRMKGRVLCCMDTVPFRKLLRSFSLPILQVKHAPPRPGFARRSHSRQFICIFNANSVPPPRSAAQNGSGIFRSAKS